MTKWNKLLTSGFAALACVSLVACGADDPKDVAESVQTEIEHGELTNTWINQCSGSQLLNLSERMELDFTGNQFTKTQTFFADENCQQPSIQITYEGEFQIEENVQASSDDVNGLNLTYEAVHVTPLSESGKSTLETVQFCGQETWAVNETVDLSQGTDAFLCPLKEVPSQRFDVYLIENDQLFLGSKSLFDAAENPSERPTSINREQAFTEK